MLPGSLEPQCSDGGVVLQHPVGTRVRTLARDAQGAAGCLLWLPAASSESSPGRERIRETTGHLMP